MKILYIVPSRALFIIFFTISALHSPINSASKLPTDLVLPDDDFWKEDAMQANNNVDHFEEPADSVNYADYHYVGAHNAHVYPRFFETVRQQDQTTLGQLSYGIRGFMWDSYDFNLPKPATIRGPEGAKVCLSHPAPGFLAYTQKGHNSYQSLQYELRRLIEFMKRNPKAIITIIFEDYANVDQTDKEIELVIKAANYDPILKPADWNQAGDNADQQWPTLGWMRQNNKRLIMFSQNGKKDTTYTWRQFTHCIENQYSTTNENNLCTQRSESQSLDTLKRKLVIFNDFSSLAVTRATKDAKMQVSYETVKRATTQCQAKGFANKRSFNAWFADRVIDACNELYESKQRTVFEYVNELNKG